MPFLMTHLIIAKNLSKIFPQNICLPQLYLGSIAPDAVHFRPNYVSDYKKASHLIVGPERWGLITNNDEWENDIIAFLDKNIGTENHDFILGYCTHILSDLYNNVNIWTPFRLKYPDEIEKGYGNLNHQEHNKIDIELALTYEGREDFWSNLIKSTSLDLPGIIYAVEIDKQKNNILDIQYKDKERPDIASNQLVTYESTMDFINKATNFVAQILRKHL